MVQLEGLGKLKKFNDLIRTRTWNLPACSIALNGLRYHVPLYFDIDLNILVWHFSFYFESQNHVWYPSVIYS
jgi:hypothetical protein